MPPAVRLYGKTGTFYGANGETTLPSAQTFDQVAVASWDFHAGKSAGWSAFYDNHLFIANSDLAGELAPSGTEMVVSVFDTVAQTIVHNVIPTSLGATSVLTPGQTTGGSSVNDADVVDVGGEKWVVLIAGFPYHGWNIAANGLYPTFIVFRKIGGTWQYDATKSKTADQLHQGSAAGAAAFAWQQNSFGETYAYNHLTAEIAVTPASQKVVGIEYFNDKGTVPPMRQGGGAFVLDPGTGVVLANWINPYNSEDPRVNNMGARGIVTDPTGTIGHERFAVVYDTYNANGTAASIRVAQLFNWDSTTNTITPISPPFQTNSPIGYSPGAVFFDSDGNLWVVEQGGFLDAGDTVVYPNYNGKVAPELEPYDPLFRNFGVNVEATFRVPTREGGLFILSRPLEDTANKVVFWHSATGQIFPIKRWGTGATMSVKALIEADLNYKSDIEPNITLGNRGILFPSDGAIDNVGRKVWWPIAQLDSAHTTGLSKPHALDQWVYRADLDRLFQSPVFIAATSGQKPAFDGNVTPTLPVFEKGDWCLFFLNMAGGEVKVVGDVAGWDREVDVARSAGGFGSHYLVFSRQMQSSSAAPLPADAAPTFAWTGGANTVDWITSTWRDGDPAGIVDAIAATVAAPSTTDTRPSVTPIAAFVRAIGLYGADGGQTFSGLAGEIARQTDNGGGSGPAALLTDEETLSATAPSRSVTLSLSQQHGGVTAALAPAPPTVPALTDVTDMWFYPPAVEHRASPARIAWSDEVFGHRTPQSPAFRRLVASNPRFDVFTFQGVTYQPNQWGGPLSLGTAIALIEAGYSDRMAHAASAASLPATIDADT